MFRYSDTKKVSQPGESQFKVVTAVRHVTYINNNPNPKVTEPTITEGWEIVSEALVSENVSIVPKVVGKKTVDGRNERQIRRDFREKTERKDEKEGLE